MYGILYSSKFMTIWFPLCCKSGSLSNQKLTTIVAQSICTYYPSSSDVIYFRVRNLKKWMQNMGCKKQGAKNCVVIGLAAWSAPDKSMQLYSLCLHSLWFWHYLKTMKLQQYENWRHLQHWHFPTEFFSTRCEKFGHVKNSDGLGSYFRESFSSCPPL